MGSPVQPPWAPSGRLASQSAGQPACWVHMGRNYDPPGFRTCFQESSMPLEMVGIKEGSVLELEVKDPIDVRPLESRGR